MPQNLFAQKIKEHGDKKAKAGGKLVDATAVTNAELQAEPDKIAKNLRNGGQWMRRSRTFRQYEVTTAAPATNWNDFKRSESGKAAEEFY